MEDFLLSLLCMLPELCGELLLDCAGELVFRRVFFPRAKTALTQQEEVSS
jgi:hypothetical protein